MTLADPEGRRQSVRRFDEGRNALMKGILLRWLARYDAWCQEWGLPENRRCCAPVRCMTKRGCAKTRDDALNDNCASRRR